MARPGICSWNYKPFRVSFISGHIWLSRGGVQGAIYMCVCPFHPHPHSLLFPYHVMLKYGSKQAVAVFVCLGVETTPVGATSIHQTHSKQTSRVSLRDRLVSAVSDRWLDHHQPLPAPDFSSHVRLLALMNAPRLRTAPCLEQSEGSASVLFVYDIIVECSYS